MHKFFSVAPPSCFSIVSVDLLEVLSEFMVICMTLFVAYFRFMILYFFKFRLTMPSSRVYVGRVPNNARERDVEKFFKGYGSIREVILKNGYGFVVRINFTILNGAKDYEF